MHTSLKRYRERKSVAILRNVRRQLNNNCYILVPRWLKIQIYYSSTLILFVSPLWQIIDSGKEKSIGKLEFPLAQLLKSERMTIEQPFPLKESGHNSTLTCKFMLKVNFPVKPLPRFLPKDQCLNFGCCKCWIWPISLNRPLLTYTVRLRAISCLLKNRLGRIQHKWAVWA